LFAACSLGWLIVSLLIAPSMSGIDVFYFRDAGWNLAATGHFESAALAHSHDLVPRLYSYYTPMMPLLFAGYASVFPRNAYAGTVFNLLLGLLAAAVALFWVLRQPSGKLRNSAAVAIAILPVVFITYDRPEALGLVLACLTIAVGTRPGPRPWIAGLLAALTFLDHPFSAVIAAGWVSALFLSHHWSHPGRWPLTLRQIAVMGGMTVAGIAPVALLFYVLDPTSLTRFATNAFVVNSELGVSLDSNPWDSFVHKHLHLNTSPLQSGIYALSLGSLLLLAAWCWRRRRDLRAEEWFPLAACFLCPLCALLLFPGHPHYVKFLAFLIPIGLLIANPPDGRLNVPGLGLLLFAMAINLPNQAIGLLQRIEELPSYRAAQGQPAALLAQMASPEDIVALEGESYDLFKAQFHHLIALQYVKDEDRYARVAAVANCYDAFHGPDYAVRPLPDKLNAADFHMIQADPQHMWVTIGRHRIMSAQWGYGCDLYVRNSAAAGEKARVP
jgi:hypothetical protein